MYQSFTGTSRRPRQVNLSGRPSNPFASSSASSGAQAAILSAQQDRLHRQQQRERLEASNRIQRVWRGHSARRKTFQAWRQIWDEVEEKRTPDHGAYASTVESLRQFHRLMLFYRPRDDVRRLMWYGMRQIATSQVMDCESDPWPTTYARLTRACTRAVEQRDRADDELDRTLLMVMAFAARRSSMSKRDAVRYYKALVKAHDMPSTPRQNAFLAPLSNGRGAYAGLAVLLAEPLDNETLGLLRSCVDAHALSSALLEVSSDLEATTRSRLWLLGNTLCIGSEAGDLSLTAVVARLLGSLADSVEFEGSPIDLDNITFDHEVLSKTLGAGVPLNVFLHEQTKRLVDQSSIRNLLMREASSNSRAAAQLLAGYALTLLRCFPRRADEIRMWLYLGPTSSSDDVPPTQYFWNAAKATSVFSIASQNSLNIVQLIIASASSAQQKDEWTVIITFMELYTFLLKITDDEEFMGSEIYGRRNSSIPLNEVAELVTFLKNLGFTLCFNASELNEAHKAPALEAGNLNRYFGSAPTWSLKRSEAKPLLIAGLPSLTVDYLKGLVTGLLRAIYERDSRRHFLPSDHWLMTSRFNMTAFIPGVVAEEESRHTVQEQDAEDKDIDESDDEVIFEPGLRSRGYATILRNQERRDRAQRRASRKRYLESVAPRLEILQNMPFFIPFTTRVEIFRQFVQLDQEKRRHGVTDPDMWRHSMMMQTPTPSRPSAREFLSRHHANVRRKNEFQDAFEQFYQLGAGLKEPIQITFEDEFGIAEAGIDGGGVTKEFLTSVINQAFDPENREVPSFFVENDKHLLFPNPTAVEDLKETFRGLGFKDSQPAVRAEVKNMLQQYEFLGRIIGKCLYEGILVDVSFAGFFLKKWALTGGTNAAPNESGYRANINDLKELDEGLYKGLLALKNATEDVESFGLTFTIDDAIGPADDKRVVERELVPNGAQMPVTNENKLIYINRMAHYRLQGQSAPQTQGFLKGLSTIIQPSWLGMFNQAELQTLVSGAQAEIDVSDLRRNTLYGGVYAIGDDGREHPSVRLFWQVMHALPDKERRQVLKFVTSTPRGPLLGFAHLNPRFSIRDSGSDEGRYPTTSTCVNLLKLPMYKSERVLREKLLSAVNSGAGFDLS